jgi:hypothetical protein
MSRPRSLIEENIPTTKELKARQEFLRGVRKTWTRKVSTKVFYPTAEEPARAYHIFQ